MRKFGKILFLRVGLIFLLLIFAGFPCELFGQEDTAKNEPKDNPNFCIPFDLSFAEGVPQYVKEDILGVTQTALGAVLEFLPESDNLYRWKGDREILKGKTFSLYMGLSDDPFLKEAGALDAVSENADAMTVTLADIDSSGKLKKKEMIIALVLFVDRIFWDEDGNERKDAFTRMTVALAHESLGNVQKYLEMDLDNMPKMTVELRKELEINAFKESIAFLEKFIASEFYKNLPTDKLRNDFQEALKREKVALKSWEEG